MDALLANERSKSQIRYRTTTPTRFGLSFDYRWLGVELFTRMPADEKQTREKGKTQSKGVFFRANKRRFWATLYLQHFKGFYWSNPSIEWRTVQLNVFPQRPDIADILLQTSAYYIFKPDRFSNMGAQGENERQLRSGGSFFAGGGFAFNRMWGDTTLIPSFQRANFAESSKVKEIRTRQFHLSGGYAHTWVLRQKWFASIYLIPGLAHYSATEIEENQDRSFANGEVVLRFENRISLGYNSDKFFAGIWFHSFLNNQTLDTGTGFSYGFQSFRIYAGKRFLIRQRLGFLGL